MIFAYRSPFGVFVIRPHQGRWGLWCEDELYGSYHSPQAAADDVYMQATGHDEWDMKSPDGTEPTDLSEWERIR